MWMEDELGESREPAERAALQAVLSSRTWMHAAESGEGVSRGILEALCGHRWSGQASALSAKDLCEKVYGSHRSDEAANMRKAVGAVRALLKAYYLDEGKDQPIRLAVGIGRYRALFERVSSTSEGEVSGSRPSARPGRAGWILTGVATVLVLGLAARAWRIQGAAPSGVECRGNELRIVTGSGRRLHPVRFDCALSDLSAVPQRRDVEDLDADGVPDVVVLASCEDRALGSQACLLSGRTGRAIWRVRLDRSPPGHPGIVLSPERVDVARSHGRPVSILVQSNADRGWALLLQLSLDGDERGSYWFRGTLAGRLFELDVDSGAWYLPYRDAASDCAALIRFDADMPIDGVAPTAWPDVPPELRRSSHAALMLVPRTDLTPRPYKQYVVDLRREADGSLMVVVQEGTEDEARGHAWYRCGPSFQDVRVESSDSLDQLAFRARGTSRVSEAELVARREAVRVVRGAGGGQALTAPEE